MKLKPFERAQAPGIHIGKVEYWINNRYQVMIRESTDMEGRHVRVLSIRRLDRKAIFDWRDLQWIKNQLLGPEEEAVQLFPAESRLVDTSNQYWLYSYPGARCGLGFEERVVSENISVTMPGHSASQQRPFAEHVRPPDLEEQEARAAAMLCRVGRVTRRGE